MKPWVKVVAIAVPSCILLLAALIYGCYLVASKAIPHFESQVVDPKFAATVASSMVELSDPPPEHFEYKGAVDMLFTKVVILARGQHFIILIQTRQSQASSKLSDVINSGHTYGPLTAKSFESDSSGEMNVANGTMDYELGHFKAQEGGTFRGMIGILRNKQGQARVLVESFDRSRAPYDFEMTKKFLTGVKAIK